MLTEPQVTAQRYMQRPTAITQTRAAPQHLHTARKPQIRHRSNVLAAQRSASTYALSSSSSLNKVLFTIPVSVQYGESLSVSGEGQELGAWSPENSLPLKWNEGNIWAAEIPLPTG